VRHLQNLSRILSQTPLAKILRLLTPQAKLQFLQDDPKTDLDSKPRAAPPSHSPGMSSKRKPVRTKLLPSRQRSRSTEKLATTELKTGVSKKAASSMMLADDAD
jgi:hypothetical protein